MKRLVAICALVIVSTSFARLLGALIQRLSEMIHASTRGTRLTSRFREPTGLCS